MAPSTPADPQDPAFFHMLRYMARPAVALSKMTFDPKNEKVIYRANFNAMLGTDRIEVDPLEFVAKVLMHVPDKNMRRVTGYGVYSSRALGERRKRARGKEQAAGIGALVSSHEPLTEADEFAKRRRQSRARLIQNIWEISIAINVLSMRRRNESGLRDYRSRCDRQKTQSHREKGSRAARRTSRRLIARSEDQGQVNDETVTTVEKEIRSMLGVLRAFAQNESSDRSGVLPFSI